MRQVTHALLTRPPLSHKIIIPEENQIECFVRLACVKHAASVHPEPGSNSHVIKLFSQKMTFLCEFIREANFKYEHIPSSVVLWITIRLSCQNQIWLLIRNNVPIYCFKVASFIEAFLNDTTFLSSENVASQRSVSQIVTFLKIFQGFSLFSYQCSSFCCQPRQLLKYISCAIICQQLFSTF